MTDKPRILILGGGFAALETAFLLRMRTHEKKMLGFYLPMRFGAGEPFHAGAGWKAMDVGLRGMAGMLAD